MDFLRISPGGFVEVCVWIGARFCVPDGDTLVRIWDIGEDWGHASGIAKGGAGGYAAVPFAGIQGLVWWRMAGMG